MFLQVVLIFPHRLHQAVAWWDGFVALGWDQFLTRCKASEEEEEEEEEEEDSWFTGKMI